MNTLYESIDRARRLCPAALVESTEEAKPVANEHVQTALTLANRLRPAPVVEAQPPAPVYIWG